jgi:hypothetical protein
MEQQTPLDKHRARQAQLAKGNAMGKHKQAPSKSLATAVTHPKNGALTPPPDARAWLEHCPPSRRSAMAHWFHLSIRIKALGAAGPAPVERTAAAPLIDTRTPGGAV